MAPHDIDTEECMTLAFNTSTRFLDKLEKQAAKKGKTFDYDLDADGATGEVTLTIPVTKGKDDALTVTALCTGEVVAKGTKKTTPKAVAKFTAKQL